MGASGRDQKRRKLYLTFLDFFGWGKFLLQKWSINHSRIEFCLGRFFSSSSSSRAPFSILGSQERKSFQTQEYQMLKVAIRICARLSLVDTHGGHPLERPRGGGRNISSFLWNSSERRPNWKTKKLGFILLRLMKIGYLINPQKFWADRQKNI